MTLFQHLTGRDENNAVWQRDLAICWQKIAGVRQLEGNGNKAEDAYANEMKIVWRLIDKDPMDAGCQRDLAISWEDLGDLQRAEGELKSAEDAYGHGLQIFQQLTSADETMLPGSATSRCVGEKPVAYASPKVTLRAQMKRLQPHVKFLRS